MLRLVHGSRGSPNVKGLATVRSYLPRASSHLASSSASACRFSTSIDGQTCVSVSMILYPSRTDFLLGRENS